MSTNYYIDGIHIGKKNVGWAFIWKAYPEKDIFKVSDWFSYVLGLNKPIIDEYDREVSVNDFFTKIIREKGKEPEFYSYIDSDYHYFSLKEFC